MLSCDADGAVAEVTKIRKRCALPSSRRTRLRLKRSVRLIGRSRSPCKTTSRGSRNRRMSESSWNGRRHHTRVAGVDTRPASARKLVTALWQLDRGVADAGEGEVAWDAAAARRGSDLHRRSSSMELSKLSIRKTNALLEGSAGGERSWHNGHAHDHWTSDALSNGGGAMEAGLASPCPGDGTAQLQALYNSMTASKELVRVLANVLAPGALSPTAASLLAALRSELDAARARARQIAREQRRCGGDGDEAERLREEMRAWKSRHREKVAAATRVVASELDAERRARQRAERVGKKLGEALAEAEAALREARREVHRERKARELMEKACDELAAGVGLGGAADEEYEYEMRREELEREREMLQLADELREERVRMKLAEARVQFEERNAVVDRLRQELEAFLGRDGPESPARDDDRHRLQPVLASEPFVHGIGIDPVAVAVHRNGEDRCGGKADDDYSDGGGDIELNVDGSSRDYTTASVKDTATTCKNASSRHGSFSDRGAEGGGVLDRRSSQGLGDTAPDEQRWNDDDGTTAKDVDDDAERYEAIKNLREQMLAGHGFVFQGGADADDDTDRQHRLAASFVCQVDERGLW